MATGASLLNALMGVSEGVPESPYLTAARSISSTNVSNPYASSGSNLAYGLGAGLLSALIGGYGVRETQRERREAMAGAREMLGGVDDARAESLITQYPTLQNVYAAKALEDADKEQRQQEQLNKYMLDVQKAGAIQEAREQVRAKYPGNRGQGVNVTIANPIDALGQATRDKLAESSALIEDARRISDIVDASATGDTLADWIKLHGARKFSGLDEGQVQSQFKNLKDRLIRSRSGATAPPAEAAELEATLGGDFTVSPRRAAQILKKWADQEARLNRSVLDFAEKSSKNDFQGIKNTFEVKTPIEPPKNKKTAEEALRERGL